MQKTLAFVFSALFLMIPALASAATPTFAPQIQTPAGAGPEWFAVADFNGDTFSDFAVADVFSNQIGTALGNGTGSFGSLLSYPASQPHAVAAGDLNGDTNIDLVTADTSETLKVLLGNGTGTFVLQGTTYPIAGSGDHVILADVNNDLKLDAIVVHQLGSTVSILLGNGDGTFAAQQSYAAGSGPGQVSAGDFNGDNKLDLAITDNGSSGMVTLLGNGDGSFQSATFYPIGTAFSTAIGDLNGDNQADLAVGTPLGVGVMLGNGDGTFQALTDYAADSGQHQVAIGDFNGDNIPDIAASNSVSNTLSVLVGNGDGTFQPQISFASAVNAFAIVLADFNNDGKKDVAITGVDGNVLSVHINTTPSTVAYYRFETGPDGAAASSIVDSSGNGLNGTTFLGAPTYSASFPISPIPQTGAVDTFSGHFGVGQASSFAYQFPFNTETNATLEFWVKPTGNAESGLFWTTIDPGDLNRYNIHWDPNEVCADYREPDGTPHEVGCTGVGTVPVGVWSFVAIVKEGNTYKMYVNGPATSNITVPGSTHTDVSPNLPNSSGWTMMGRCGCQPAVSLDEVRLSNQALTPSQFLMLDQAPTQVAQTITFNALLNKTLGDADFAVSASASSGLTVSFTASGQCTVTGANVHLTGLGTCTITAHQAGNASYFAAPDVSQSFAILYRWDGFLQPINDTAHQIGLSQSVFKAGSTVPVKLQLKRADGTVVLATVAPLWLAPQKGAAMNVAVDETLYTYPGTVGNTFKLDGNQYSYNWSTKGLAAGFWYKIFVKLDDGTTQSVIIGLK